MSEPYTIHFSTDDDSLDPDGPQLVDAVDHALRVGGREEACTLTVRLTDNEEIRRLNRQYAGIDAVTDVLSFPAEDEPYAVEPGGPPYLGDVIIAVPVAKEQAMQTGRSLLTELQVLAIHGTLHLLGYDHHTYDGLAEMQACESEALKALRGGNLW